MPLVLLRAPLSERAGGREFALDGGTVKEALIALESARPAIAGWVLDERRAIREHVNVYAVFGSSDAGATWTTVADHLPPVHSVRTS